MPLQTFLLTRDPSLREISKAYCFDRKPEKKKKGIGKKILGKKSYSEPTNESGDGLSLCFILYQEEMVSPVFAVQTMIR